MNSRIKQKWVDALRSGKYSQDTGVLRSTVGYCCLGVLCDLYRQEHNIQWDFRCHYDIPENEVTKFYLSDEFHFDGELEHLPDTVKLWAGLNDRNPHVHIDNDVVNRLSELNDNGASFNEIADLIEKYEVA